MAEEIAEKTKHLSLNENSSSRFKFSPELVEYQIKSKISDTEKKFSLPTPENLSKLFDFNVIKDQIVFNMEKYKKYIKNENDQQIIDLTSIQHIQNSKILNSVLFFLGAINSENDIYEFDDEEEEENELRAPIAEDNLYEHSDSYIEYLQNNLSVLIRDIAFIDFSELIQSLKEVGIEIRAEDNNTLYRQIKDSVMSTQENKIMILIAPSNNFYVKTEKSAINGINYDFKINNITKVFLNNTFIKQFIKKIANHPRCYFGLLSSMIPKNLRTANSAIQTQLHDIYPKHYSLIDQTSHDSENLGKKGVIPKFYRNLNLIMNHIKNKDKIYSFNETNILIIDGKDYKISESTKFNTINVSVFNEELLRKPNSEKNRLLYEKGEKLVNYVYDLLENCPNDVRDYIALHPYQ